AHNMNDDAETLLMNLLRGSGSYGGASIAEENGKLLRPMLKATRAAAEEFLKALNQDFVYDSTNDSQEYTRNFIRKTVIPELQRINPRAVEALSGFASSCRDDREYFEAVTAKHLQDDLRTLPKSLRDRVILRKYKEFSGKIANSGQLKTLNAAADSPVRTVIRVDCETEAVADFGRLEFVSSTESVPEYGIQQLVHGENPLFGGRIKVFVDCKPPFGNNGCGLFEETRLDAGGISGNLYARQRRTGDKIQVRGINKSLKKMFIDCKVPAEIRDIIPVICDGKGIIYVPFTAVSDRVFTKSDTGSVNIAVCGNIEKGRWQRANEE
ncbi:MAG: tRNA lysidine(34) synthetase TilS, partial [Clostridia bacterium]|nr:tRNA lysidine(34) synthetase TilS [Clostridia bacterium]